MTETADRPSPESLQEQLTRVFSLAGGMTVGRYASVKNGPVPLGRIGVFTAGITCGADGALLFSSQLNAKQRLLLDKQVELVKEFKAG